MAAVGFAVMMVASVLAVLLGMTRTWSVRLAVGIPLAATLALLCAAASESLHRPGFPLFADVLALFGPLLLLFSGVAWLIERQRFRRSPSAPAAATSGFGAVAIVLVGFSVCMWVVLAGHAQLEPFISKEPPNSNLVLPLPDGLTLVDQQRDCGSEACSRAIVIGSPDHASQQVLTERLWTHLQTAMGWQRLRPNRGTWNEGWFFRRPACLYVVTERPAEPPGQVTVILHYDC